MHPLKVFAWMGLTCAQWRTLPHDRQIAWARSYALRVQSVVDENAVAQIARTLSEYCGKTAPVVRVSGADLVPSSSSSTSLGSFVVFCLGAAVGGALTHLADSDSTTRANPRSSAKHHPDLDTFTRAYLETALYATTDGNGNPFDKRYQIRDFTKPTLAKMIADAAKFHRENARDIGDHEERAGRDFWLTREGHGAGFWDGDWPEPAATRLTKASKAFGEFPLTAYRGKIHGL